MLLDVYRGSTLPGLVLVTNTPANLSGTLASSITWEVIPGESYQIAVAGSFFDKADIPVALSFGAAPANDQFANSAIPSGENVFFSGTTFNATRERLANPIMREVQVANQYGGPGRHPGPPR